MKTNLYKIKKYLFGNYALKILLVYLIYSLISLPLYAQDQRRGLFLQDEQPSLTGDFEDNGFGMEEGRSSRRQRIPRTGMVYQIHVLGEVVRPGTYRISPSMRVTDAILRAGGIQKNGSERFIEFRMPGRSKGKLIDLFAYKILGKLSQNPYLQDNYTIYVPLKKRVVEVEGPVRRPGYYELKNERNLNELIKLAGGFTVGASKGNPIKIVRYMDGEEKQVLEILPEVHEMSGFSLKDGDVAIVPHKFLTKHKFDYNLKELPNDNIFYPAFDDKIFVIGAVKAPGAFKFNQYYTLRQYLTLAGGTTIMAKRKKIKVVTVAGKTYKAKGGVYDRPVNPGDTIVVPEKSIPTSFYIGLMPTIASLGLSAAALFR